MYCNKCGTENDESFAFCMSCGEKLEAPEAVPEPETKKKRPAKKTSRKAAKEEIPQAPEPSQAAAGGVSLPAEMPSKRTMAIGAGGCTALAGLTVVIAIVALLILQPPWFPIKLGSENRLIVAQLNRSGEADLYVVKMNQALEEGLLVDPFVGSGTSIISAVEYGMSFLACDRESSCCEAATNRLNAYKTYKR